jgi:hypothetical protein
VVKNDILAAKLTGDDAPATAEDLKLLLCFEADADAEALRDSSASSMPLTGPLRPTTIIGLRSASAVASRGRLENAA